MTTSGTKQSRAWLLPVLTLLLSAGVVLLAVDNLRLKRRLAAMDYYYLTPQPPPAATPGSAAPPFDVLLPDGTQISLRTDSLSAPLLLAWLHADCDPCRDARNGWNYLADIFPGQFWAVSLDPPGVHDTAFSSDIVRFPVVATVAGAPDAYRARVTPTTIFVRADGTIGQAWQGPLSDSTVGNIVALMGQPYSERR